LDALSLNSARARIVSVAGIAVRISDRRIDDGRTPRLHISFFTPSECKLAVAQRPYEREPLPARALTTTQKLTERFLA